MAEPEPPRAELDALCRVDALLRTMAPAAEPPAGLRARTLAAVAAERTPAPEPVRPRWRLRWAAGFAATAAAAALVLVVLLRGGASGTLELEAQLRPPGTARTAATAEVRLLGIGRAVHFRSTALPILPRGEFYELWFVGPGDRPGRPNRISAGTFHPDPAGVSDVRLTAAVDPARYPALAVTAEPGDGDPRPSGREVLRSPG